MNQEADVHVLTMHKMEKYIYIQLKMHHAFCFLIIQEAPGSPAAKESTVDLDIHVYAGPWKAHPLFWRLASCDVEHRYSLLFLVLVGRLLAGDRACRSVID